MWLFMLLFPGPDSFMYLFVDMTIGGQSTADNAADDGI